MLATFTFTTAIIRINSKFIIHYTSPIIQTMSEFTEGQNIRKSIHNRALSLLGNEKINTFTSDYIMGLLSRDSLIKIEQFMRKNKILKISEFLRFFRQLLPFNKNDSSELTQFFLHYALFKLFSEICNSKKKTEVTFADISSYIAERMPNFTQQSIIQQKLLPLGLNIDEKHKTYISPPEVFGQILQQRCFLSSRPIKSDRMQHLSREVGQSQYSKKFKLYFSIDKPSIYINILDDNFNIQESLKTEQEMTKRDMVVIYIAWSDREQKIACILGNYSISMWSKQDNYKYEVNVPLPAQNLSNPYVMIKYMDSMRKWITLDNRPVIYVLDNRNYEPEFTFMSPKIKKKKQSQKIHIVEFHYVQLVCIGFQRNLFLVSLKNKEIISEIHNFRTGITSIAFSQSYQALFVSTYEMYFRSFELSQFQDLMQRGKFEGHKSQISILGVIQQKPVVFSLQQNSILKMFDIRDYACYQSVSVLKNILYKQVLHLDNALCLVGSKMHVYSVQKELTYQDKEKVLYIQTMHKDLLIVTNKDIRIYDIRNGALKSVIKALFGSSQSSSDVFSAFTIQGKDKLFIQSQQGECIILETNQMSEIAKWNLDPKPKFMFFDSENDLLTQVSHGNIYVNLFSNQYCQKELRREIINKSDSVRNIKVSVKHDLMLVCYEGDESLYFYAYQKGKQLGYLNFGDKRVIKFQNAYKPHIIIHRVVDFELYESKNVLMVLLSDELLVLTYKRTMSSLSFFIKKSVQLWKNPIKLFDGTQYTHDQNIYEQPLHSTSLSIFPNHIAITSNKTSIMCCVSYDINRMQDVRQQRISKDNYNPSRIGSEEHAGSNFKNPSVAIVDYCNSQFKPNYYLFKHKIDDFVIKNQIGNLLIVADTKLNLVIWQSPHWNQIAGIINCASTLPKIWNIFKYSQQEINQVEFVLDFIENQKSLPEMALVKNLVQQNIQAKQAQKNFAKITISQLINQDKLKGGGLKLYRSCSLREKKIVLEKQREEREKYENFLEQQKIDRRQKPNNSVKNQAQKQISDTLGYLSVNHNQVIMKKGIADEDFPAVRALQKKLLTSINKQEKKSLISYKTGEQSARTNRMHQIVNSFSLKQAKLSKTLSTQMHDNFKFKFGSANLNSKQLIQRLNLKKSESQRKLRSLSKQFLPKIRN